ncbi:TlpA disulfide reductase family protein [Bhargavaea cecembensis]|uniref:TlpA disulfide reductase family protein n=1 Tax=Bhargavaea cecembensis TaxID=394098 RepID=UPI0006946C2D|nr:TlpA disulfide reductase family protein [Bhargavaea cecembensis]
MKTLRLIGSILAVLLIAWLVFIMVRSNLPQGDGFDASEYEDATIGANPDAVVEELPEMGLKPGELAPDFELATLDGKTASLSDYRGKKVVLNFWATWCPPCREEMPHMQRYYEENGGGEAFEIVAVNATETERGNGKAVAPFVEELGLTFPILMDEKGNTSELYEILFYPVTYIIDEDGVVIEQVMQPLTEKMMDTKLN